MNVTLDSAIIGVGVVLVTLGLCNLVKGLTRRRWPETVGKIQKNEVKKISTYTNYSVNSDLFSWKTARPIEDNGKADRLWLSYVYVVGKYKYVGNQLYSAPVVNTKNRLAGLYEGDKVKVFYNPQKPEVCFLAHSFSWPSLGVIFVGVVVCLGGVYFEYFAQ